MRTRIGVAAALLTTLLLGACERMAAPSDAIPPASFSHATTADISGYYMPVEPVRIGRWRLDHIFVGQAPEFEAWEDGVRRDAFAPLMVQFADATSPTAATGPGQAHSVTARVLPTRYEVTDMTVSFEGQSPQLGKVSFTARLDPGALATAKRNLGGDGVVMTGALTAGGQTVRDVRLRWWMGD